MAASSPPARAGRAQQAVWAVATLAALLYPIPFERSGPIYSETGGFLGLLNAIPGIRRTLLRGLARPSRLRSTPSFPTRPVLVCSDTLPRNPRPSSGRTA